MQTKLTYLHWRLLGVGGAVLCIALFDPSASDLVHALVLPVIAAVSAYLISQAIFAVAFATSALAWIHSDLNHPSWIISQAYPALASIALGVCLWRLSSLFRQRIQATRAARWASRM